MYEASSEYRSIMRSNERPYNEVYGVITFSDNTTLDITPSIIPEKSLTISRQCINDKELEFGGVFSHILNLSVRSNLDRYKFFGAEVVLNFRVVINNAWEVIPLGIFTISNADRPDKNTVKFTAYDNMRLLDKEIQADFTGTPFDILNFISTETGMRLSFTRGDISDFPNANSPLSISTTTGIKTYRDAVKIVCQQLACFAQANREGELELRRFNTTVDITLTTSHWFNLTVADYECRYKGISITSESGNYAAGDDNEQGSIMTIPDAPAWDKGDDLQQKAQNVYEVLHNIRYTPCNIDLPNDPSFDCGDRIKLRTSSGDEVETIITNYEWKWHGGMEMDSQGVNPYLEGASTNTISSTRLLQKSMQSDTITYHRVVNPRELTIDTTGTVLYEIDFAVAETTEVNMWHEFIELNTFEGNSQSVQLFYYYDDELLNYSPIDTYAENGKYHTQKGDYWRQSVTSGTVHNWRVEAKTDNGIAVIPIGNLLATLWGQKVYGISTGGNIEITEDYIVKALGTPRPIGLDDSEVDDVQLTINAGGGNYLELEQSGYLELEQGGYLELEGN